MPVSVVRVETVELDSAGSRQISSRLRATDLLQERRGDIEAAIAEAGSIVQASLREEDPSQNWGVTTIEATFGLTLTAEAGVILSKASAEASFEVTLTLERK